MYVDQKRNKTERTRESKAVQSWQTNRDNSYVSRPDCDTITVLFFQKHNLIIEVIFMTFVGFSSFRYAIQFIVLARTFGNLFQETRDNCRRFQIVPAVVKYSYPRPSKGKYPTINNSLSYWHDIHQNHYVRNLGSSLWLCVNFRISVK